MLGTFPVLVFLKFNRVRPSALFITPGVTNETYHSVVLGLNPSVWQDSLNSQIRFSSSKMLVFILASFLIISSTTDLKSG